MRRRRGNERQEVLRELFFPATLPKLSRGGLAMVTQVLIRYSACIAACSLALWALDGCSAQEHTYNPPTETGAIVGSAPHATPVCPVEWQAVATTPAGSARRTLGVGELDNLSLGTTRSFRPTGNERWFVAGDGRLVSTVGQSVQFVAGDVPGRAWIWVASDNARGDAPDKHRCSKFELTFDVVAPTGLSFYRVPGTGISHQERVPDIGIKCLIYVDPRTASFEGSFIRRLGTTVRSDGIWARNDGLTAPGSDWLTVGPRSQLLATDTAYTGATYADRLVNSFQQLDFPFEYRSTFDQPAQRFTTIAQRGTLMQTTVTMKEGACEGSVDVNARTSWY